MKNMSLFHSCFQIFVRMKVCVSVSCVCTWFWRCVCARPHMPTTISPDSTFLCWVSDKHHISTNFCSWRLVRLILITASATGIYLSCPDGVSWELSRLPNSHWHLTLETLLWLLMRRHCHRVCWSQGLIKLCLTLLTLSIIPCVFSLWNTHSYADDNEKTLNLLWIIFAKCEPNFLHIFGCISLYAVALQFSFIGNVPAWQDTVWQICLNVEIKIQKKFNEFKFSTET